jgi:hypothetical protein
MSKRSDAEVAELRAEVEALKAEVAFLRTQQAAHVCPSWPQPAIGGGVYVGDVPPLPGYGYTAMPNICGAAAGVGQTQFMDTACATTTTVTPVLGAAAGCAPQPQIFTLGH